MKERTKLLIIVLTFVAAIPWENETIRQSGLEAFMMLQEYAREHVLTCLIPAFLCHYRRPFHRCRYGLWMGSRVMAFY